MKLSLEQTGSTGAGVTTGAGAGVAIGVGVGVGVQLGKTCPGTGKSLKTP